MAMIQKITPFLWYEKDAIGVARYYKNIFGEMNVVINEEENFSDMPIGAVQVITLTIFGQKLRLMSAGKHDDFNDAISFEVACEDQAEIDNLWAALTKDGGQESKCGWCIDAYGVRWQIVPKNMSELTTTPASVQKMLSMTKIIIADLQSA